MTNIDNNKLVSVGLSLEQSKIYSFLIQNGLTTAKVISAKTGIGRTLTYKVLDQLISLGLVKKREDLGKIILFSPEHPELLKQTVSKKEQETKLAKESLSEVMGQLTSEYNMLAGKPNVQFFESRDGLQRIYDDILEIGKDIMIISSPIDKKHEGVLHLIREQIEKQVAKNIRTKAITPIKSGLEIATPVSDDEKFLISRKIIPSEKLNIPAQIIVYGDKVGITNFKETIISVLIESKYIAETFRSMFDYIWSHND